MRETRTETKQKNDREQRAYSRDTGRGKCREGGGARLLVLHLHLQRRYLLLRARGRDETCPVSTGGATRRVRLVREGRGGGGTRAVHMSALLRGGRTTWQRRSSKSMKPRAKRSRDAQDT